MGTTEERREAVIAYVRKYRREFNVGPSYAEIAQNAGYASPAAARKAVLALCGVGRLARHDGVQRSIFVPDVD